MQSRAKSKQECCAMSPTKPDLIWEQPLGTIRGQLEEPGPRFVDPHLKEEREAIQAEGQPSAQIREVRAAG
jgi:hypothetical protein